MDETKSKLILVVDDDAMNREVMEAFLSIERYRVELANNGERALKLARELLPDLMILDVRMPDMSGYDVCKQLKAAEETNQIPIMMVTGFDSAEDRLRGIEAGADGFLSRPFGGDDLIQNVRDLLAD